MLNIEGATEPRGGVFFCQPQGEAASTSNAEITASETASLVQATFGYQERPGQVTS